VPSPQITVPSPFTDQDVVDIELELGAKGKNPVKVVCMIERVDE
jgi:hypothetical protein